MTMKFIKTLAGATAATVCGGTIFALGSIKTGIDTQYGKDITKEAYTPVVREYMERARKLEKELGILMDENKDLEITNEKEDINFKARWKKREEKIQKCLDDNSRWWQVNKNRMWNCFKEALDSTK